MYSSPFVDLGGELNEESLALHCVDVQLHYFPYTYLTKNTHRV